MLVYLEDEWPRYVCRVLMLSLSVPVMHFSKIAAAAGHLGAYRCALVALGRHASLAVPSKSDYPLADAARAVPAAQQQSCQLQDQAHAWQ